MAGRASAAGCATAIGGCNPGRGDRAAGYLPLFRADSLSPQPEFALPHTGELSIWLVLDGTAELASAAGAGQYRRAFRRGETVLVPASAGKLVWRPLEAETPPTLLGVRVPAGGT